MGVQVLALLQSLIGGAFRNIVHRRAGTAPWVCEEKLPFHTHPGRAWGQLSLCPQGRAPGQQPTAWEGGETQDLGSTRQSLGVGGAMGGSSTAMFVSRLNF